MFLNRSKQPQDLPETERLAWLRLARTENVGPITFYQLIERFGSATAALNALPELSQRGGRRKPLIAASGHDTLREYESLKKIGGQMITPLDESYPLALAAIDDAPPVLSILGKQELLNSNCIAIVGARNASLNGRKFAHKLAHELGARGQKVASGLARGIDSAAHQGSLNTGTIAVVAGGIDIVYPQENQNLYNEIREHGLIVAESKLGQQPFAQSFPRRNRIVSGLSRGVVVVEATLRSGSLITARMAGEQGRELYAVPGSPMDPRADGPNHLIREGATLVRNADDILENLLDFTPQLQRRSFAQDQQNQSPIPDGMAEDINEYAAEKLQSMILTQLSFTPISVDELIRVCHVTISAMQSALLELELAGRVKRLPGNRVNLLDDSSQY